MTTFFSKNRFELSANCLVTDDQPFNNHCESEATAMMAAAVETAEALPSATTTPPPSPSTCAPEANVVTTVVAASQTPDADQTEVDVLINNVVCHFSLGCHLNLRHIALNGHNVEYRRENGMVTMKLRRPHVTASVWSSGKITCTGATSEDEALAGARRVARTIQKLGYDVKFRKMRIVNVLGCCSMPFEIRIHAFSQQHREAEYEPELHPGVTYKVRPLKATVKIFSTGSITVTAPSVCNVQSAVEYIFPLVHEFRKEFADPGFVPAARKRALALQRAQQQRREQQQQQQRTKRKRLSSDPANNGCSSNDDDDDKEVHSIMSP